MILGVCLFLGKWFSGNYFPNFHVFVCYYKSWSTENSFRSTENTFQSKGNLAWFSGKRFPFIFGRKHFLEVVKNLEMLYYLLIISFIYQILFSFFWLLLILFEIIYEMFIIIILISSSFIFFRFDLYYFDYYLFYLR